VNRVREVYGDNPENLMDFTMQDSIILNIQRACEASIDLAMHIVSDLKLGLPKTSREAFKLLEDNNLYNVKRIEWSELVDSTLKVTDRTTKLKDSPSKLKDRADFALSLFFRNREWDGGTLSNYAFYS